MSRGSLRPTRSWLRWPIVTGIVAVAVVAGVVLSLVFASPAGFHLDLGGSGGAKGAPATYPVTFRESGLTPGSVWGVTVGGHRSNSTNGTVQVALAAGSYGYVVAPVAGFVTPAGGTVVVSERGTAVPVTFYLFNFTVEFTETGLALDTSWSVSLGGLTHASASEQLSFAEPNGLYAYQVNTPSGYSASTVSGSVVVIDSNVSVALVFTQNVTPEQTLTLGGSFAAYPFTAVGVTWFEQNWTNVAVSDNQGGNAAGMLAVCAGAVDIGVTSVPETAAELEAHSGCAESSTITITTFAYDVVDVIVPESNVHGLWSLGADTLDTIYIAEGGGLSAFASATGALQPKEYSFPQFDNETTDVPQVTDSIAWDQIPAAVLGASLAGTTEAPTGEVGGTFGTTYAFCTAAGYASDLCATSGSSATPCGFTVCAGGVANGTAAGDDGATIQTWSNEEMSGTEQLFTARLMGIGSTGYGPSALGFTGCANDGQLDGCGLTTPEEASGDLGMVQGVSDSEDAIGFASDTAARTVSYGNVMIVPFVTFGQTQGASTDPDWVAGGVLPTLGGTGTIAAGVLNETTGPQYVGGTSYEFVTLAPPTGAALEFFTFVLDPANNVDLATVTGATSIYAV